MRRFFTITIRVLLVIIIAVLAMYVMIQAASWPYIYHVSSTMPSAQAAIVLGASVLPNRDLSPILKDRADKALQLYQLKKVSKILVSGDNGVPNYNEVNPVGTYLVKKGVPDQDIFLDHAGFDTYSSMYRARNIFKVDSALIVSQSFHLPRAVFIARQLGIEAYGANADGGRIRLVNYIREVFANQKAVWELLSGVKPKYLGPEMPITGTPE